MTDALLRGVLALLAAYHLGIGLLSVSSLGATGRVAGALYGVALGADPDPRFRHAVRMLGLYALALGTLLALAARDPLTHRDVIAVVAALQLARAAGRLLWRETLATAFGVPPRRNAVNAALLVAEAAALAAAFPRPA